MDEDDRQIRDAIFRRRDELSSRLEYQAAPLREKTLEDLLACERLIVTLGLERELDRPVDWQFASSPA